MIRGARFIAVDGAHGTGKTTLVHALASRLKEQHVHVGVQNDAARQSPLVEDVVVNRRGEFDLVTELHVLGAQLAGEQILARHHDLVLCDKSLLSVIAYTNLFVADALDASDAATFGAMAGFIHRYAARYDAVFLLTDFYDLGSTADAYRVVDPEIRCRAAALIRTECDMAGVVTHDVPRGLSTAEKVGWVLTRLDWGSDE